MPAKRFNRAFLHIGLGKTGSSTIQRMLLDNAKVLEERFDIHFPCKFNDPRPFKGNHSRFMASLFGSQPEFHRANVLAGFNTPETLAKSNKAIAKAYRASFERSSASQLLISAEGIGRFRQEHIAHINNWLREFADDVTVIACLRHPLHVLASEIQQRVKTGATLEELYDNPPFYPFQSRFSRLETVFGKENIVVYDFGKAIKSEGGLVGAFLERIGVDPSAVSFEGHAVNESMSHEAVMLLSALNEQRPMLNGNQLGAQRSSCDIRIFRSIPGRKFRVPQELSDKVEKIAADDLRWLEQNYGLKLDPVEAQYSESSNEFSASTIRDLALKIAKLAQLKEAKSVSRPGHILGETPAPL